MNPQFLTRIRHSWRWWILLPTLFYALGELAVALFQPVRTDDIFWHLKIGEILLHEKSFLAEESLLFTSDPKMPPLYHEWLFQIAVKSVENFGGLYALRFFLPLCVLCILWALLRLFRLFEPRPLGVLLATLMFVLFSYQRLIQLRPELFSMIFLFVLLHNVVRGREHFSYPRILLTALLSLLWANSHSLCLILFLFWGAWIACAWIYSGVFKHPLSFDWKGQISGFFCSIFCMSANPMGLTLFYFYFKGNARNPYVNVVDEWGHLNFSGLRDFLPLSSDVLTCGMALLILWSALLFVALVLDLRNKPRDETESLERFHLFFLSSAALLAVGLSAYAVRFFWLVPFPVLLLLNYFQKRPFIASQSVQAVTLLVLCALSLWHFRSPGTLCYRFPLETSLARKMYWKWDYDRSKYHGLSVKFLRDAGVEGRIFNPYFMGGFLSYRLNPKVRVFIDGRFEHYTEEVNRNFADIKNAGPHFQQVIQKYGIDLFFVPAEKDYTRLLLALKQTGRALLHHDETALVFADKTVFEKADLQLALARHYGKGLKKETIPLESAERFAEFLEKDLRAKWAFSPEQLKSKTPEEIRTLCREPLENQLHHGFLDDALAFYEAVSDRIPLEDPFFSQFREVFAQRNQLDWQFSGKRQ